MLREQRLKVALRITPSIVLITPQPVENEVGGNTFPERTFNPERTLDETSVPQHDESVRGPYASNADGPSCIAAQPTHRRPPVEATRRLSAASGASLDLAGDGFSKIRASAKIAAISQIDAISIEILNVQKIPYIAQLKTNAARPQ